MKSEKKQKDIPFRISPAVLQRKFNFNYEIARSICEFISDKPLESSWIEVSQEVPKHKEEVIGLGKPFKKLNVEMDYYICIFDHSCGWTNKDDSTEILFIEKWMRFPDEIVEKGNYRVVAPRTEEEKKEV